MMVEWHRTGVIWNGGVGGGDACIQIVPPMNWQHFTGWSVTFSICWQTCIVCKMSWKNVSFNVFFSFFPFFFLLYQKVIQLKTIDFFRSHIFSVRVIFCLIHPVPRSYLKQKWHGPHQRLAYCNRTWIYLLNKNIWRQNCLKPPLQGIVVHARFTPCRVEYDFFSLITN